jgi:archaellum component FlaC
VLGGNHRRLALKKYIQNMESEVTRLNRRISDIKTHDEDAYDEDAYDENADQELSSDLRDAIEEKKALVDKIVSSCMWSIKVYNRGAW